MIQRVHDNGSISGMDDKGVVGANWAEEVLRRYEIGEEKGGVDGMIEEILFVGRLCENCMSRMNQVKESYSNWKFNISIL